MNRRFAPASTQLFHRLRKSFLIILVVCAFLYSVILLITSQNVPQWSSLNWDQSESSDLNHFGEKFNTSPDLFLIEPAILLESNPEVYRNWFASRELHFDRDPKVLTLGTFDNELSLKNFKDVAFVESIYGKSPFLSRNLPLHHLVTTNNQLLHIVVFYKFENYFWVGDIPQNIVDVISKNHNVTLKNFGLHEQIFDPFNVSKSSGSGNAFRLPTEVGHFLGQISTSRYLPCTEASHTWAKESNVEYNPAKARALHKSIISMKSLMKKVQFEFWIFCGTLLGWYRQCNVIPYTTDADYATWATSLAGKDYSPTFAKLAKENDLKMLYRFGEPTKTQEFSLTAMDKSFKSDLFFIYSNETNFRLPWHVAAKKQWTYSVYPRFELCSAVLMGEKVLVPCTPEDVIQMEYTSNWRVPVTDDKFDWIKSPKNVEPFKPFDFNVSQYTEFK